MPFEKRYRRRVEAVSPRREDADMAPIAQVRADSVAGFIELHRHAARDQVRRRSKADRAAADDGDGKVFENRVFIFYPSSIIEIIGKKEILCGGLAWPRRRISHRRSIRRRGNPTRLSIAG